LVLAVRAYRLTLSPAKTFLFGPHAQCRFTPSCSEYALDAVKTHGAAAGTLLAAKRLCRCHPWGDCGYDPVPGKSSSSSLAALKHCAGGAAMLLLLPRTTTITRTAENVGEANTH